MLEIGFRFDFKKINIDKTNKLYFTLEENKVKTNYIYLTLEEQNIIRTNDLLRAVPKIKNVK